MSSREVKSVLLTEVSSIIKEHPQVDGMGFDEQIANLNAKKIALEEQLNADVKSHTDAGYRAGYDAGMAQGKIDGKNEVIQINEQNVTRMAGLIKNLENELSDRAREIDGIVSESIGIALKNSYFGNIKINRDIINDVVETCLSTIPIYAKTVILKCSKDDYHFINEHSSILKTVIDNKLVSGEISINTDVNLVKVTGEQMAKSVVENIMASDDESISN